jgi:hypothetical protein
VRQYWQPRILTRSPDGVPRIWTPPESSTATRPLERQPSGVINGIPYYHLELSHATR